MDPSFIPAMASSSTSSVHKNSFKYDVFLSFRGEDTRTNFVDHLYDALKRQGIDTYKDDKNLEKGKKISKELIQAIEESRFHVIVFSKNYASSSWCLDELVKIMECQKRPTEHTVYPIFYHVEPTHVRKQSGEFGKAFAKLENDEAAKKWKEALIEATSLSGRELRTTTDGHEVDFIKLVIKDILLKLPVVSADENLVGMRMRVNGVVSSLNAFRDEFCMIGIWGMGGGGKTTLARAVFDQICNRFEGISFVENVREASNSLVLGLRSLQQQVLRDVLNKQDIFVNGIFDGKKMMKKYMLARKVLVVLDDVDHIDQLKALAGEPNWFKPGSKIIITTRDKQVLLAHKVNLIHDVNLLTDEEAICLLSRCAFGTEIPSLEYKKLSKKVVSYAAGLPLTITILGSALYGETEYVWKDTLKELEKIPLDGILQKLELSYMGLDTNCKEIFLDVACILKGMEQDEAIRALESCGFHAIRGLSVLEKRSLITISEYGRLDMHDHIQEMGRYIVRRLHLQEPNKHSRLWIGEEINDILVSDQGTKEAIRCIKLSTSEINPKIVMKGLNNMKQLRLLLFDYIRKFEDSFYNNWKFDEAREYIPNALRCLIWTGYPFRSLPKSFQANNLVALKMDYSNILQLWEYGDTKFLDLKNSKLKSLDLGLTPNLERLCLKGCSDLVELCMPVECPKLIYLDLSASKLTTLDLRGTLNIEELYLDACHDLVELHIPNECLKLKSININYGSKLRTLDIRGTSNIEKLNLFKCVDLAELHIPVECLKLVSININDSKLRTLDIRGTSNIEKLNLFKCVDLAELHIPVECLKLVSININDSKLSIFDLGWTLKLKTLSLTKCPCLLEVYVNDGCLKELDHLDLSLSMRFEYFLFRKAFDLVEVGCVSKLHLIAESLDMCPLHFGNNLPKFRFKCFYEEHGPSLIGNVEKLISFGLCTCTNLDRFSKSICGLRCLTKLRLDGSIPEAPKDLDQLECLKELYLLYTKITYLPDNICFLKHLKCLELNLCWHLEKLPEDLGRLECLEKLILIECVLLREIPDNICKMKCLRYFHLKYSVAVKKLPEEFGCLTCLEELNIEGTGITQLPQSVFLLKGLRIVASMRIFWLCGFTSEIHASEYETFCYI
ncbi:hypothetical protein OSB04_015908 [Centaurea solstitialis]|uniref:TIR domain-containing protein n=1 Tax=Centaurea solstitialis TaxID=347529 RepID=A0AA38T019_9ASTR|nr:hypothetical protein OSB04_015908 [Centaurea solstitialis]